jgi:hypothetical protein
MAFRHAPAAEVQADELLAGVAVGGALLEGLAVEGGGLVDVAELRLVEEAELDQRGGHGGAVVAAQVLDAPAQQGGELGVGAELLVELAQEVEGADVLGLGLQRADQSVGRLGRVLDAVVPQLVGLEGQLADLGGSLIAAACSTRRVASADQFSASRRARRARKKASSLPGALRYAPSSCGSPLAGGRQRAGRSFSEEVCGAAAAMSMFVGSRRARAHTVTRRARGREGPSAGPRGPGARVCRQEWAGWNREP